jgi:hypothetical protein
LGLVDLEVLVEAEDSEAVEEASAVAGVEISAASILANRMVQFSGLAATLR